MQTAACAHLAEATAGQRGSAAPPTGQRASVGVQALLGRLGVEVGQHNGALADASKLSKDRRLLAGILKVVDQANARGEIEARIVEGHLAGIALDEARALIEGVVLQGAATKREHRRGVVGAHVARDASRKVRRESSRTAGKVEDTRRLGCGARRHEFERGIEELEDDSPFTRVAQAARPAALELVSIGESLAGIEVAL